MFSSTITSDSSRTGAQGTLADSIRRATSSRLRSLVQPSIRGVHRLADQYTRSTRHEARVVLHVAAAHHFQDGADRRIQHHVAVDGRVDVVRRHAQAAMAVAGAVGRCFAAGAATRAEGFDPESLRVAGMVATGRLRPRAATPCRARTDHRTTWTALEASPITIVDRHVLRLDRLLPKRSLGT
jgi:hypothetical protein